MLTFELNEKQERIEIYMDAEGAAVLQRAIRNLCQVGGHDHFMTPAWSGHELSELAQGRDCKLVHHVIFIMK